MFEVRDRILNMKWLMSDKEYPMFEVRDRILNMKWLISEVRYRMLKMDCQIKKNLQLPDRRLIRLFYLNFFSRTILFKQFT